MQKKLIALAIAGLSGTAFAQSNVTVSGFFDTGFQSFKSEAGGVTTTQKIWGSSSNSGTTNITFKVTEDLGNGLKASLHLETDPTAGSANAAASLLNSQNFLALDSKFGTVKLGFFNNFANTTATTAQPFGTAMGGGWSSAFGRLDRAGVVGAPTVAAFGGAGARDIRANNAIGYTTPSWNGFTAGLIYRGHNSDTGATAGNGDGQTQVGLNYNNGPLNISGTNSVIKGTAIGATLGAGEIVTHNLIAANYAFGPVTVYGGWTSSKGAQNGANTADSRSWNLALKWNITGNIDLLANTLKVDDKRVNNQDRTLNALGLNYGLSKRTNAYVRYESGDNDKAAAAAGKFTRWGLGLAHTF